MSDMAAKPNLSPGVQTQGGISSVQVPIIEHDDHAQHDEPENHDQHWLWKYVFSQDHKQIAKQFLITGMIWAIVGGTLSSLFRLQLGWPEGKWNG